MLLELFPQVGFDGVEEKPQIDHRSVQIVQRRTETRDTRLDLSDRFPQRIITMD
jgi:hypothetical protein